MSFNFKTDTPSATISATGFLFGAESQGDANPKLYEIDAIIDIVINNLGTAALADTGDFAAAGHNHDADYQPLDADLTALAGLTSAADKLPYFTGSGTADVADFTSVARTLVAQTTQALMRTTGLGFSANGSSLVAAADYAAMRSLLDLEAGTDFLSPAAIASAYQPLDADLTSIAALTTTSFGRSVLEAADAAALATLAGVGTGDSPQFAAVNFSHATATTVTGASGVLFVEGLPLAFRRPTLNAQVGTTYTLALTDDGVIVIMSNGSANTVTIPANAAVAFEVGTIIEIRQIGAGATTIEGDTGVTLNGVSAGGCSIQTQYQGAVLLKTATNTWIIAGDIDTVA